MSTTRLFVERFGEAPSIFTYALNNKKIKSSFFTDDDVIKEIFPKLEHIYWQNSGNDDHKSDEDGFVIQLDSEYYGCSNAVRIIEGKNVWLIDDTQIVFYYSIPIKKARTYFNTIIKKIPFEPQESKKTEVELIACDRTDYYTVKSNVNDTKININENYNDDFQKVYQDIVNFLNQRSSGLIILNGAIGTGKTHFIRHLISNYPKEYIIITNLLASHLAQPEFISFMLSHKDSVFILEDCEQVLIERSENTFSGAIANILNMSDGLMSDVFNVKFICTFNADIGKIDPALLRKGRCYARYEFGPLTADKVKNFCKVHNIELPEYKPMTLAELYNVDVSNDYSNNVESPKIQI